MTALSAVKASKRFYAPISDESAPSVAPNTRRAIVSAVDVLLPRLDGARRTGKGWIAKCPGHVDHSPSLTVGHGRDGRVLVHCFGGCDVIDVLAAIGLSLCDLFPEPIRDLSPLERDERRRAMRESALVAAISVVDREAAVILAAATVAASGEGFSAEDRARLLLARQRISDACEVFA